MPASICKVVFWIRSQDFQDPTFDLWPVAICTQTVLCLSILSACVLYLRPFFETLESGWMRVDDIRRRTKQHLYGSDSYHLDSGPFGSSAKARTNAQEALTKLSGGRNETTVMAGRLGEGLETACQDSDTQVIRETLEFGVDASSPIAASR